MSYENVKLWFAKDENQNIVTINDINEINKNNTYLCPMCNSDLLPKAVQSKRITPHFAHVDKSKCNSETMIHWWFKHKFIEKGDSFTVVSDKEKNYICKEVLVEREYDTSDKTYRPDVTILTECGDTIYFEMAFSNTKKVKDYLDIWLELKNIVVEVDIKQLMIQNEIPKFKALFYDGKCFNIKRNDTYYNTIGKFKEEKLRGEVDKDLKERIKKLDWFWDEMTKYKKGEVDIDHMVNMINVIDAKERVIIKNILMKQKCTDLYNDYLKNKSHSYLKDIQKFLNDNYPFSFYKITLQEHCYGEYNPMICLEYLNDDESGCCYNIERYSCKEVIKSMEMLIKEMQIKKTNEINLEIAKNNKTLEDVINKINMQYKEIDGNYNFHDRFKYNHSVSLHYNYDYKLDFLLPEDIMRSNDESFIYSFLKNKIENYTSTIKRFQNFDNIENILNKIVERYNKILYKDKVSYQVKIARRQYETRYRIEDRIHEIRHKRIAEDMIDLDVGIKLRKGYKHYHIYIYQESIYLLTDYDYKYPSKIVDNKVDPIFNYSNVDELEIILINILNKQIKYSLNENCVDCDSEIDMTIGEINFFVDKNLSFPKRCKCCRKKRKQIKE